jgi:hypothetical protein
MRRCALGSRDAQGGRPGRPAAARTAPAAPRRRTAVLLAVAPLVGCLLVAASRADGGRVAPEPARVAPEPASVLVADPGPRPARLRRAAPTPAGNDLGPAEPGPTPIRVHVHRVSNLVLADDTSKPADPKKPAGPCGEASVECRDALEKLRLDALSSIDLDIRVGGRAGNDYPCECRLEGVDYEPRRFASTLVTWKAAGYCHKPLYFEHWALERYGHSRGFVADSFCSAAHFFVTLPVLPYKMGVELPWECVYPLGYYRPGNCAPWTVPAVPISGRGLAVQAATVTGLVFLLP